MTKTKTSMSKNNCLMAKSSSGEQVKFETIPRTYVDKGREFEETFSADFEQKKQVCHK